MKIVKLGSGKVVGRVEEGVLTTEDPILRSIWEVGTLPLLTGGLKGDIRYTAVVEVAKGDPRWEAAFAEALPSRGYRALN